jgi:hypothetical protein
MNNREERRTEPKRLETTNTPSTRTVTPAHGPVELPIIRLEGRRRLHGRAWAQPSAPAAAAMPIDRSRLTRLTGRTIMCLGAGLVISRLPA